MDLILLDMIMPLLSGMDTARELRQHDPHVPIIFLTSSPEFALESYEVRTFWYLLKPLDEVRFHAVLDSWYEVHKASMAHFAARTDSGYQSIYFQDVEYLEAQNKNVLVTLKDGSVISCGGGELMCEILDKVDFDRIRVTKPKWYMGFSDNTNMTFLLATLCDTASIYGPCAAAFGMEPWHDSLWDAYHLLRGEKSSIEGYALWEKEGKKDEEHPLEPYNVTEEKKLMVCLPEKQKNNVQYKPLVQPAEELQEEITMQGRLLGGCMDCLVNLLGTEFDKVQEFTEEYQDDGIIWFLESCDLNVMSIRRAVWQMKHAGWFSHVKGFLIGRPAVFGQEMMGLDMDVIRKNYTISRSTC